MCVWCRDQEAAVMRANSWLYHYYMVQSKLQYGMQFEAQTSPRAPSTGPAQLQPGVTPPTATPVYAYHHQQSPHQQDGAYPSTADHQHHQHHQQHQQQQHQQQQQQPVHFHQLPDGYFRYAASASPTAGASTTAAATTAEATMTAVAAKRHRLEPEPVDYSIHSPEQTPPLKIEDGGHSMASDSTPSPPSMGGGGDSGGGCATATVAALSSSLPSATSLGRSRALVKAAMDPGDLMMETWNPSPPWSDCCSGAGALQKVPDVDMLGSGGGGGGGSYCGQPTPPTPGSGGSYHASSGAPQQHHNHHHHHHPGGCDEVPTADTLHHHHHHHHHQPSTFTFDWPGEQYVPNVHEVLVEPTPHYIVPFPPWPHAAAADHHRLFPLQPPPPGSLNRPSLIVRVDQDAAAADASVQGKHTFPLSNHCSAVRIIYQSALALENYHNI